MPKKLVELWCLVQRRSKSYYNLHDPKETSNAQKTEAHHCGG
jgi:hypothetical protein